MVKYTIHTIKCFTVTFTLITVVFFFVRWHIITYPITHGTGMLIYAYTYTQNYNDNPP